MTQELARERLAVDHPAAVAGLRAGEERRDRRHAGLRSPGRAPDALELPVGLLPPAVVEEALVGHELDAGGAERVRMSQGNADGTTARATPSDSTIRTVSVGPIS